MTTARAVFLSRRKECSDPWDTAKASPYHEWRLRGAGMFHVPPPQERRGRDKRTLVAVERSRVCRQDQNQAAPSEAAIAEDLVIGRRACTVVPFPLDWRSSEPPSCRILSRIPRIPTPGGPLEVTLVSFSSSMPTPRSSTLSRISSVVRVSRIVAKALPEWR